MGIGYMCDKNIEITVEEAEASNKCEKCKEKSCYHFTAKNQKNK